MFIKGWNDRAENYASVYATSFTGATTASGQISPRNAVIYSVSCSHNGAVGSIFEIRENTAAGALLLRAIVSGGGNEMVRFFPRGLVASGAAFIVATSTAAEITVTYAEMAGVWATA